MSTNDLLSLVGAEIDMLGLRPVIYAIMIIILAGVLLLALVRLGRGN